MSKSGLDFSDFKKFSKKVNSLAKKDNIPLVDIFSNKFIAKNSKFKTFDEFLETCGIHNDEEFKAFPDIEMNKFVKTNTKFSTWEDMLNSATSEYLKNQLSF